MFHKHNQTRGAGKCVCSLRNNVVKPPATAHEEKIKEKHKDGNADASSLLLFYTTVYYCFIF